MDLTLDQAALSRALRSPPASPRPGRPCPSSRWCCWPASPVACA